MQWAETGATREGEQDYPDVDGLRLNDLGAALETYYLLEAFSDGMGAWRFMDVLGCPLADLPDALVQDLMVLRRFAGIAERRHSTEKQREGNQ